MQFLLPFPHLSYAYRDIVCFFLKLEKHFNFWSCASPINHWGSGIWMGNLNAFQTVHLGGPCLEMTLERKVNAYLNNSSTIKQHIRYNRSRLQSRHHHHHYNDYNNNNNNNLLKKKKQRIDGFSSAQSFFSRLCVRWKKKKSKN